jgi:hypothetical protein
MIEVCLELSSEHNFAGICHFGVGATSLRDARAAPTPNTNLMGRLALHNYMADDDQQTASATAREIEARAGGLQSGSSGAYSADWPTVSPASSPTQPDGLRAALL